MKEHIFGNEEGEEIQFLHANAYTPGCYTKFFTGLKDYKITAPAQRPLWAGSDASKLKKWHLFVDDIVDHMVAKNRKGVIGMGHSMGGVVTLLASVRHPELFSRIVLIDPVILPGSITSLLSYLPYSLITRINPMVKIAAKRRDTWANRKDAELYFLTKKVYQRFDSDVLQDFINYGLTESKDGVRLAYPREWESAVYASAPNLWQVLKKVPCPITIIRAEHSDVINDERWERIKKIVPNGTIIKMDGVGHLVPFDQPELCADVVAGLLSNHDTK